MGLGSWPKIREARRGAFLAARPAAALLAATVLLTPSSAQSQGWYDTSWQYRKAITLTGSQIAGNLVDFPVLVSLTDTDLSARALANGFDILFTDSDGTTKLSHERARWVPGTGVLIAWVKVPSLTGGVGKTVHMYYGNAGAADQQSVAAVWTNGYEAVYHLDDDFVDATGNHAAGTNVNSVDVPGRIGDGQDFEAANQTDHIDIGAWNVTGSQITLQSWVRYESFSTGDGRVISKALDQAEQEHVFMLSTLNAGAQSNWRMRLKTGTVDASGTTTLIQSGNTVNLNTWYASAATYDGAAMRLFQNGGQVATVAKTGSLRQNAWSIWLGNNPLNATTNYKPLDGILDEVRISSVARSSSWLTTEYNNQRPGAAFYSVGSQQAVADLAVTKTGPGSAIVGDTIVYTLEVVNLGPGAASGVVITDTLPSLGTFVAASNAGDTLTSGVVTWPTITTIAANDTVSYTVTYLADAAGSLTNKGAVTSTNPDPSLANNTSTVVTTAAPDIVTQVAYAWSDDVATFASKGDNVSLDVGTSTTYILALQVTMTAGAAVGDWYLQVREDGAGPWLNVLGLGGGASPVWQTYATHTYARANGAVVPVAGFGIASVPAGFTAVDGEFSNDNNALTDGYTGYDIYTELQYAIRAQPAAAGHSYEFRVAYGGAPVDGYDVYALTTVYGVGVVPDGVDTVSMLPSNGTPSSYSFTLTNNSAVSDSFDLFGAPGDVSTILTVDSITGSGVTRDPARPDSALVAGVGASASATMLVWFTLADAPLGALDSLYLTGRSVAVPDAMDAGWVFLQLIKPSLSNVKSVSPSGTVAPGTDLTYTVTVTNGGSADALAAEVVDSIPAELDFLVGSVTETLPAGVTVILEYSDDDGSSWSYVPSSAACGAPASYDRCVDRIRWRFQNPFISTAPDNAAQFEYIARVR